MIRTVLVLFCFVGLSTPLHAQTAEDAEHFVRGVYAKYYPGKNSAGEADIAADGVTPALAALFKTHQRLNERFKETGAIDADPFCDYQDDDGLRLARLKAMLTETGAQRSIFDCCGGRVATSEVSVRY